MDMLFEVPYYAPAKKPTLLQFLKSEKSAKLKQKYAVMKIWYPKDYPTLCLETEDFRALVDESSPIFDGIMNLCKTVEENDSAIAIVINPDRDGGFGITTAAMTGKWVQIGKTTGIEYCQERHNAPSTRKHSPAA